MQCNAFRKEQDISSGISLIAHLFVQPFVGGPAEHVQEGRQQIEAPTLHGQLPLALRLEDGQVVVQLGVLLCQVDVVRDIA